MFTQIHCVCILIFYIANVMCKNPFEEAMPVFPSKHAISPPVKTAFFTLPNGKQVHYCGPAEYTNFKFSTKWDNCKNDSITANKTHPLIGKGTKEILESYGYSTETHYVKTSDGYILTVYRIVAPLKSSTKRQLGLPIYLNHALMSTSDHWFFQPKEKALPIKLYKSGFDVWLGNCRGNSHSLDHTSLDYKQDLEYWDFSFHEMALYDVPAVTDYIIRKTGYKKILYLGHSMGTAEVLIALAEIPEMNEKIEAAFLMTPAAYLGHAYSFTRPFARTLHSYEAYQIINKQANGHFRSVDQIRKQLGIYPLDTCAYTAAKCGLCDNLWFAVFGYNAPQTNHTELQHIIARFPDISSVKTISHFGQLINSCKFQKYDYNLAINMAKYGSSTPPEYNLKKVDTHIYLYYANNDNLCVPLDVNITASRLRKGVLKEHYVVPDKWFSHMDFLTAKDADLLIYNKLIEDMKRYQ